MRSLFAAVLLFAAPSWAALTSRPATDDTQRPSNMEGLYAGLGGGGALLFVGDSHAFGYDVEARLGYSFNPGLQLYLSGAVDGGTIDFGAASDSFRSEMFAVFVQYHLFANAAVGVYARVGVGIGIGGFTSATTNGVGFATGGGLGVEIRIAPGLFLTPELFYKNIGLSVNGGGTTTEQVVGLQLALIYY